MTLETSPSGQILRTFGGNLDVRVEIDTGLEGSTFAQWDISTWGESQWGAMDPAWNDITRYVLSVSIDRGRSRWSERFRAGTATVVLDNTTGVFTPESGVPAPWQLPFRPGRKLRIVALPDPSRPLLKEYLFYGEIDATFDLYDDGAFDLEVTLPCTDFMLEWSDFNPAAMVTPTGVQDTDVRVGAALDRMSWPAGLRDIQVGSHTLQSSFLAQSVLEECQIAADAEGGAFYCSRDGKATFRARDWLITDSNAINVQGYLGYEELPSDPNLPFSDDFAGTVIDTSKWNNVNTDDDAYAPEVTQNDALFIVHDSNNEGLVSDDTFDLSHAVITWRMTLGEASTTNNYDCGLGLTDSAVSSNSYIYIQENDVGDMALFLPGPIDNIEIPYDPGLHVWFRMIVYDPIVTYQCSPDREDWQTVYEIDFSSILEVSAPGFNFSAARIWMDAGESGITVTTTPAMFDDIEVVAFNNTANVIDVKTSWELARVFNHVQFARAGSSMQLVEDSSSQALYGIRSYPRTDFRNNSDAEIVTLAERFLAINKDSRIRIDEVTIAANEDPDNQDLNRLFYHSDFGDLLSVRIKTGHDWEWERLVNVMGIHDEITADDWLRTFRVDDAQINFYAGRDLLMTQLAPLAWWRFEESGGTSTADETGNGHTLTWSGGAVLAATGSPIPGGFGIATLDGTNDFATIASEADLELRQDMTIEMWVRPHNVSAGEGMIMSIRGTGSDAPLYQIEATGGSLYFNPLSSANSFGANVFADDNVWVHAVWTVDWSGSNRVITSYKNGNLSSSPVTYTYQPGVLTRAVNMGRRATNNDLYFDGDISEIAIFDRVLTPSQVLDLYNSNYS